MQLSPQIQQHFIDWWQRAPMDMPLVRLSGLKSNPAPTPPRAPNPQTSHLDPALKDAWVRWNMANTIPFGDTYPYTEVNMGAGSYSLYLGASPHFAWDTIWFDPCIPQGGWDKPLVFQENNPHWQRHLSLLRECVALSQGDYLVAIPDIVEHLDILSALQGPQSFCYDLVDYPEDILARLDELEAHYMHYFDGCYDIIKDENGGSCYTAFSIWGPGKTAKVQCDHLALMSPAQTRTFLLPVLRRQCRRLDNSLYHLDGPTAVPHLPLLMEIDELDGIQWTPGAGAPDGLSPRWYPLYDQVRAAGKCLWIGIGDGTVQDWITGTRNLLQRYGATGIYLNYPTLPLAEAELLWRALENP